MSDTQSALRSLGHAIGLVGQQMLHTAPDSDAGAFQKRAYARLIAVEARLRLAIDSGMPELVERMMAEYESSAVPLFERIRNADDAAMSATNRLLAHLGDNEDLDGML